MLMIEITPHDRSLEIFVKTKSLSFYHVLLSILQKTRKKDVAKSVPLYYSAISR